MTGPQGPAGPVRLPDAITACLFDRDGVLREWSERTAEPLQAEALRRRGADVVVQDLGQLAPPA